MTHKMNELEKILANARDGRDAMPADLARRMIADADMLQARRSAGPDRPALKGQRPWHRFLAMIGGWPGLGGMAAACATGVWLGASPPDFLPDPVLLVLQTTGETDALGYYSLVDVMSEDG